MIAYWNGNFVEESDIHISPFDLGVLRGYGVFDVMRTEQGVPFNVEKHWERFNRSASKLHLTIPVTKERFSEILNTLAQKNISDDLRKVNFRAVLTAGPSKDDFHPEPGKETFYILVTPFATPEKENYTDGAKLITVNHQREFAEAKNTNYIKAIQVSGQKIDAGALEILFVKDGLVKEASTSNFFAVVNGVLVTEREGVLLGTTRGLIIEIAQSLGISVEERSLTLEEVLHADEAFLTAVNKYVVPVSQIDNQIIGSGKPGPITQKLSEALLKQCKQNPESCD